MITDTSICDAKPELVSPSKPSRPSRAYLLLTQPEHINALSEKVRHSSIVDFKGSSRDAGLLGPPTVEFAPYSRAPNGKTRKDARQGTIDQDPEFMSFLESLTNPITKPTSVDQEDGDSRDKGKVTMTPLVQFIKDKKANKGKEAAAAKASRAVRSEKETKPTEGKNAAASNASPGKRSASAAKVEKAAREAVKVLNKQASGSKTAGANTAATKPSQTTPTVAPNTAANSALATKQRERGNIRSAAAILQRDLGIGGNPRGRGGRNASQNTPAKNAARAEQPASTARATTSETKSADADGKQPATPTVDPAPQPNPKGESVPAVSSESSEPSEPVAVVIPPAASNANKPQKGQNQQPQSKLQPPPSTSTQAFLKHANPSQGVTEPLLEEAFKEFGTVLKVEIDKKKGFAYVDFETPEQLQNAIKASPVKIAQGSVQVLERKTGSQLQAKNNARMGGGINARGGASIGHRGGAAIGGNNFRGGRGAMQAGGGRGGHSRGRGGGGRGGGSASQGKGAATAGGSPTAAPATQSAPDAQTPASAGPSSEPSGG